jgi:hypothetical protein
MNPTNAAPAERSTDRYGSGLTDNQDIVILLIMPRGCASTLFVYAFIVGAFSSAVWGQDLSRSLRSSFDEAVEIQYSEVLESTADPEATREKAQRLERLVDHPDHMEVMQAYRLQVDPKRSDGRLVYSGVHGLYHTISEHSGFVWERGGSDEVRWSHLNPSQTDEIKGDVIILARGKPAALHRNINILIERSRDLAELFLFAGLPESAEISEPSYAGDRADLYYSPARDRFYLVETAGPEQPFRVLSCSVYSTHPGGGGSPVADVRFEEHAPLDGSGLLVPRRVTVYSKANETRKTLIVADAVPIARSRALALTPPPDASSFPPGSSVKFVDFSDRATLRREEYSGVPTVTWSIAPAGEDTYTFSGLDMNTAGGVGETDTTDPTSVPRRWRAILFTAGICFAVAGAAVLWRRTQA